jgi:hypothetical protein
MQSGEDNKAQCKMKDTGVPIESQSCVIQQDGEENLAIVDQLIDQKAGSDQTATQTADVQQTATEKNQSQIHQDVNQDAKTGLIQNQNVHQVARVTQSADGSENFSHVHQDQDLSASGAATTQNQNTAPDTSSDCDSEGKSTSPNACANIAQWIGGNGGKNDSHLHQNISERAKTTAGSSTQTQESPETGIEAHIDQSNPPFLGTNRKTVHQDARQSAVGGTNQFQTIDPRCCGVGTTLGGSNNTDNVDQTAIQSASLGAAANQRLGITGDTAHYAGGGDFAASTAPTTNSNDVCRFTHHGANNEASTHFTITFDPCTGPHTVNTQCESTAAVGEGAGFCTPPPGSETAAVAFVPSTATFGNPIAPPSFGEPSDFPGPIFSGI